MNNIDKILTVANNYYNQMSLKRVWSFSGQSKYDSQVGGYGLPGDTDTDEFGNIR